MDQFIISEIPSGIWNFTPYFTFPIDRSGKTVAEYLAMNNVIWRFGDYPDTNFRVYKEENIRNGLISFRRLKNEYQKRFGTIPYINLNGEAQENSQLAYMLAKPDRTYSVAPGYRFKRLYFPSLWSDPQLDTWEERLDRICWIGRPLPERIRLAKRISRLGIGLDIYSRDPWPLPEWKGFADDEIEVSRRYRYRIVYENSLQNLYHSEKLFNSIRSGCMTFYFADPKLVLPHLKGAFVFYDEGNLREREDFSQGVMNAVRKVMYTDLWEVYSFRNFFGNIINLAQISIKEY